MKILLTGVVTQIEEDGVVKERSILLLAALLHDIGKTYCTKIEGGKIISPRHALKGAKIARTLMYRENPYEVPFAVREYLFQLICHHGVPLWAWNKDKVDKSLRSISEHIHLPHIMILMIIYPLK